jgi:hypothetical protein
LACAMQLVMHAAATVVIGVQLRLSPALTVSPYCCH